jgi:hypothetical protein
LKLDKLAKAFLISMPDRLGCLLTIGKWGNQISFLVNNQIVGKPVAGITLPKPPSVIKTLLVGQTRERRKAI